jgi:hypothetical protein
MPQVVRLHYANEPNVKKRHKICMSRTCTFQYAAYFKRNRAQHVTERRHGRSKYLQGFKGGVSGAPVVRSAWARQASRRGPSRSGATSKAWAASTNHEGVVVVLSEVLNVKNMCIRKKCKPSQKSPIRPVTFTFMIYHLMLWDLAALGRKPDRTTVVLIHSTRFQDGLATSCNVSRGEETAS